MPTIIPGYVYALFASVLVGVIIVYSCSVATVNIKNQASTQQLKNIDEYVAAQSLMVLSHTTEENQNTTQFLEIPSQVGNQMFWIQISNDSSGAWVESGFGTTVTSSDLHVSLPAAVNASGIFVSSSGRAILKCHFEDQIATLTLTSE
jgi:hypothetical protein